MCADGPSLQARTGPGRCRSMWCTSTRIQQGKRTCKSRASSAQAVSMSEFCFHSHKYSTGLGSVPASGSCGLRIRTAIACSMVVLLRKVWSIHRIPWDNVLPQGTIMTDLELFWRMDCGRTMDSIPLPPFALRSVTTASYIARDSLRSRLLVSGMSCCAIFLRMRPSTTLHARVYAP